MEKENMLKTLPKVPIQAQRPEPECKTPIPAQQQHQIKDRNSSNELRKPVTVTPDHLRVPKAFKYPERYTSPTDLMMSPITKGLLARTKRGGGGGGAMLPPGKNQPKLLQILDMPLKDVGTFQNKFPLQFDDKINNTT